MLLCDREIEDYVESGVIDIDPFDPSRIQPTSIDLTLDPWVRTPGRKWPRVDRLDMREVSPDHTTLCKIPEEGMDLPHGQFLLASTRERIRLPSHLAARVEGKSSVGRVGLAIHITAGFIDPGFDGQVTLEMYNFGPWSLRVYPGMAIGQLCFMTCNPPQRDYSQTGRYQGQQGPTESRYKMS